MKLTKTQIAHIKTLEQERKITPERVVTDAKRQNSPLHGLFNWNVRDAARQHWLHTARQIIGAVQYEIVRGETVELRPQYVNVPGTEGRGYQRVEAVREDRDQARRSLVYTLEVAAGHLQRALDLAGPLGLTREIDHLLSEIAGVQRIALKKKAA